MSKYPFLDSTHAAVPCTTSFLNQPPKAVSELLLLFLTSAVSYLEKGAVALQPGGAQRGDGAQTAPEMDARQQGTVGQQQTGGSL